MSIGSFFDRLFNRNQPKAPKTLRQSKKSILLNRYYGIVYFLIGWHAFGYVIAKSAHNRAQKEGIDLVDIFARQTDTRIKQIEITRDFKVKVSDKIDGSGNDKSN